VRADYRIDVTGIYGRVVSRTAYQWSGTAWVVSTRTVNVANDGTQMEASLDLNGVTTGTMAMAIVATDWRLLSDGTGVYSFLDGPTGGTRSDPGFSINGNPAGAQLLLAKPMSSAPNVNGDCTDTAYDEAGSFVQGNMTIKAGTNGGFVYLCIQATADTSDNGATDFAYIHFDRDDSGAPGPSGGDRRFQLDGSDVLTPFRGNSANDAWESCPTNDPPSALECDLLNDANAGFVTFQSYEFKIHYLDVWNTTSPSSSQRAGFAILVFDSGTGTTYRWGSDQVQVETLDLNTWGHLDAPEFHDLLVPVAVVGIIYFVARRRRRDADS